MDIYGGFICVSQKRLLTERLFHSKWPNLLNQSEASRGAITYLESRSDVRGPDSSLTTPLIAI